MEQQNIRSHESTLEKKSPMSPLESKVSGAIPASEESSAEISNLPKTHLEQLKANATKLALEKSKLNSELKRLRIKARDRDRAFIKSVESWNKLKWLKRIFREIELPAEDPSMWRSSGLTSRKAFEFVQKSSSRAVKLISEIRKKFLGRKLIRRDTYLKLKQSVKSQDTAIESVGSAKSLIDVITEIDTMLSTLRKNWVGRTVIRSAHLTRIKHLRKEALKASKYVADPVLSKPPAPWWPVSQAIFPDDAIKTDLEQRFNAELQNFLNSTETLQIKPSAEPLVSIIIAVYNKPEFLFQCLKSIINWADVPYEVIVWDDASTVKMDPLYDRVTGAKIIKSVENLNFVLANNEAAKHASGEYLLLLNSDAQISGGALSTSIDIMQARPDVGVVGGCLILPDGTVQEAGNVVWNDASCAGIGRGLHPGDHRLLNASLVDYCSGAFFLTSRKLWNEVGGFDPDFAPAYYEETDFCLRLRSKGWNIAYNPDARIFHYEFATNGKSAATDRMTKNRNMLLSKHRKVLETHHGANDWKQYFQKGRHKAIKERCLFIDDEMPSSTSGSGLPRAREIMDYLNSAEREVSMLATNVTNKKHKAPRPSELKWVNELRFESQEDIKSFLTEEIFEFDVIFVSRPHNKQLLDSVIPPDKQASGCERPLIVYDAEAIFAEREILKHNVLYGYDMPEDQQRSLLKQEIDLMTADIITAVSENDARKICSHLKDVATLSINYATNRRPGKSGFAEREGQLFVGPIWMDDTPNADGIYWMVDEVLPLLWKRQRIQLRMAGHLETRRLYEHLSSDLRHLGPVDDLDPLFDKARVFVCPIRFAAGTSLKALDAMAAGLPMVCTPLMAKQLNAEHGKHVLTASSPQEFADMILRLHEDESLWGTIRQNALTFIAENYSRSRFESSLDQLLEKIRTVRASKKLV